MLYTDLAKEIWESESPFAVVGWAGIGFTRSLDLSSFAPDWSCLPKHYAPLTSACYRTEELGLGYKASGDMKPRVDFMSSKDGTSIRLEAIVIDTIYKQTEVMPQQYLTDHDDSRESRASAYHDQMKWFDNVVRNVANSAHNPNEVWRTLIVDRKGEQYPAPAEMFQEYREWLELTERIIPTFLHGDDDKERQLTSEERSVFKGMLNNTWSTHVAGGCSGRRFCITQEGRMAMVLPGTQVGDKICIASGAATPWVIRPMNKMPEEQLTDQASAHIDYQLVGECYVHGVMGGEAWRHGQQTSQIHIW
jgi:hypothetical protein